MLSPVPGSRENDKRAGASDLECVALAATAAAVPENCVMHAACNCAAVAVTLSILFIFIIFFLLYFCCTSPFGVQSPFPDS